MRSLEISRARWQATTKYATDNNTLKKAVRIKSDDNPCILGLRSVCWKIFLLFQTTEVTAWSRPLQDSRSAYTSLREHFLRFIEHPDEIGSALDPLDDDQHSPWNTLRQDEEMRAEIFQDVERCMPEEAYFRQPETQQTMLNILFIFCKINQDVGYRQGMHELLAPILWVVEQDAIAPGSVESEASADDNDAIMKASLDARYIEHDAFTLLSLIMRSAKSFYELGEPEKKSGMATINAGAVQNGASPIVERSKRIHEDYLARVDPGLAKHLTDIEVLPQIFLIRWIRLLFGREFPFDDLLALWDTLLSEDPALELVDMVCVAMLLRIRWQLVESNYSFALMLLLKYPSPVSPHDPHTFVDDAIFLRDNFHAAGGAQLINKYSGKTPAVSTSYRPSTPPEQKSSAAKRFSRTRSPLQSPARFLQQQGGVEALFQGAAKGVFERGEKLGINQAVRNAVDEVRKNMQDLQTSRAASLSRKPSDVTRWSLDEGRAVSTSTETILAMNRRNKQLAAMLDDAMGGLRKVSMSSTDDKETYIQAMDLAVAKVDFVKVYLEDATIPLPDEPSKGSIVNPNPPQSTLTGVHDPLQTSSSSRDAEAKEAAKELENPESLENENNSEKPSVQAPEPISVPVISMLENTVLPAPLGSEDHRPKAPVPTRSSIAQSSFSWMLEPDVSSVSGSSPPKSPSPFLKSTRKPTSGVSREKAAFLFGDDEGESSTRNPKLPSLLEPDEGFNLGTMKGGKNTHLQEEEEADDLR
ncbi:tbc domain-containing protein [Phlyctema vagabunda]|uniref:Tbc domain-containing protein n=1 Tax=Phlyctema vagabunda TaxID=108571 RepID=A0ABR4PRK0_9HELO